jgi:hypothetical protein
MKIGSHALSEPLPGTLKHGGTFDPLPAMVESARFPTLIYNPACETARKSGECAWSTFSLDRRTQANLNVERLILRYL